MNKKQFKLQELRMEMFLHWLRNHVHNVKEITNDNYDNIFNNIDEKAKV